MLLIESLQYSHWPCQYLSIGNEVQLVWGVREGGEVGRGLATLSNHIVVCLCVGKRGGGEVGGAVREE